MTKKQNRCVAPVTLVVADYQNVGSLFKYRHSVEAFVRQFGPKVLRQAYHYWRNFPALKEHQLLMEGWSCIDVPTQTSQALDEQLIRDCRNWREVLPIKTVVLMAGDKDFAPLVQEFQHQEVKVIVIGRRGSIHKKLRALVPHDCYAIEDLPRLGSLAA